MEQHSASRRCGVCPPAAVGGCADRPSAPCACAYCSDPDAHPLHEARTLMTHLTKDTPSGWLLQVFKVALRGEQRQPPLRCTIQPLAQLCNSGHACDLYR